MGDLPEDQVAALDDTTALVMLLPDDTLTESFILIRKLVEAGNEVLAATPVATRKLLEAMKDE